MFNAFGNILTGFGLGPYEPGPNEPVPQQQQPMIQGGQAQPAQYATGPDAGAYLGQGLQDIARIWMGGQPQGSGQLNQMAQRAQMFNAQQEAAERARKASAGRAASARDAAQKRWEAEMAFNREKFAEQRRQFDMGGGAIKEAGDGTLLRIDRAGNVTPIWSPTQGGLTPRMQKTQQRVQGMLNNLSGYAEENAEMLDYALGPMRGGDSWASMPSQLVGSLFALGSESPKSTWEVRDDIAQKVETLAATMKPLIREKGEGPWTDADQARLVKLAGDLQRSRNAGEFHRRLKNIQGSLNDAFGTNIKGKFKFAPGGQGGQGQQGQQQDNFSGWKLK